MTKKKPPPFQNIDLMQPRSAKVKRSGGCGDSLHTNVTAEEPNLQTDHIVGSVGCYHTHHPRSSDDY